MEKCIRQGDHREKSLLEQARIDASLRMYLESGVSERQEYPFELENKLIGCVNIFDNEGTVSVFRELFMQIRKYEEDKLDRIKVRAAEICTLLSRACIARGTENALQMHLNYLLIENLNQVRTIEEIEELICRNMDIYLDNLKYIDDGSNRLVRKVSRYVMQYFPENISLSKVGAALDVNPEYLSTQFRQVTGMNFREYLNRVRIEEARRLIVNTNYTLLEIAIACGFRDQSYFTKIFKKFTGKTPRQYR